MDRGFRRGFTAAEKTELWDRWKREAEIKGCPLFRSYQVICRRFANRTRRLCTAGTEGPPTAVARFNQALTAFD